MCTRAIFYTFRSGQYFHSMIPEIILSFVMFLLYVHFFLFLLQSVLTSYQPAMAGYQVPLASNMGPGVPQARPSYKRDPGKKKGKK